MSCACGCCAATHPVTPASVHNAPGLDALTYRVGTHGTFLETMLARLTSHDLPESPPGRRPLQRLTARTPEDPSIALLDAWATIGDVLTFYQERIANEGFLRTASERRSLVELGRLLGYELRPPISSSAFLAFTIADDPTTVKGVLITAGTRAQSLPPAGGLPASFETAEDLLARAEWNTLLPRTERPQRIDLIRATFMPTLAIVGVAAGLAAGDVLLFEFGEEQGRQVVRRVDAVALDHEHNRTTLTLGLGLRERLETLIALMPDLDEAPKTGIGTLPAQLAALADDVRGGIGALDPAGENPEVARAIADDLQNELAQIAPLLAATGEDAEAARPWLLGLAHLLTEADPLHGVRPGEGKPQPAAPAGDPVGAALEQLTAPLTLAPSAGPRSAAQLARDPGTLFGSGSDLAAQLLAAQRPELAGTLHRALGRASPTPAPELKAVYGLSKHPQPFGATAPKAPHYHGAVLIGLVEWNLDGAATSVVSSKSPPHSDRIVALDARYPSVAAGSWVVVERPAKPVALLPKTNAAGAKVAPPEPAMVLEPRRVKRTGTRGVAAYNMSASVTRLDLGAGWLGREPDAVQLESAGLEAPPLTPIRHTTIHIDAQPLELAPDAILDDVTGDAVTLDGIANGLDSGRRLVLTGERTDIAGVAGVQGGELVMLAASVQEIDPTLSRDTFHTTLRLAAPLSYRYDRKTVKIWGNVARATQGETHAEVLGAGDPRQARQTFRLSLGPLTHLAAANALGAQDTLEVRVDGVAWHETDDLMSLQPGDRRFLVRTDDGGATSAIFGGAARLPSGPDNVRATYRAGSGSGGNVEAGKVSQLLTRAQGGRDVVNPLPATAGADREGIASARRSVPLAVMALDRLVSVADYADFAQARAGIGKAAATRLNDGRRQVVHVTVAGVDGGPLEESADLFVALRGALADLGDPSLPLVVAARAQRLIVLVAAVRVQTDYAWPEVEPRLRAALLARFGFDARAIGEPVVLSKVVATAQGVRGVDAFDVTGFALAPEAITPDALKALQDGLVASPPDRLRVALASYDPGADRFLPAELAVLSARVPDTLILEGVPS
jgi:predicted phage baseplate assembly protein